MILHIVNKSPYQSDALASCLRVIGAGDALLLIEEGVYAAAGSGAPLESLGEEIAVYALTADLSARGLREHLTGRVQTVDDGGFVELAVNYAKSHSWY